MPLTIQKLNKQLDTLGSLIYENREPVADVKTIGNRFRFPEEADRDGNWMLFEKNGQWGGKDHYQWFRCSIRLAKHHQGRQVVFILETGREGWNAVNPQFLLFVNGSMRQGMDTNHTEFILTDKGVPGEVFTLDLAGWSGMEDSLCSFKSFTAVRNKPVFNLYHSLYTAVHLVGNMADTDTHKNRFIGILDECVNCIDFRVPHSELFSKSIRNAKTMLDSQLYRAYGNSSDITASCVGHTHIDVAWLWTTDHTREKAARSFSTVLELMERYSEFKFMSSQPQLYAYIKEDYPELFARIKERIIEGRWEAEGGMWVEADCNLISGESFARQFLYGKKFFKDEFGVDNKILWLPDVFGYSASMPQILKKCGIDFFMTTKISWNQFNRIPVDSFYWRGIDGTEVLTHFITMGDESVHLENNPYFSTYNGMLEPGPVIKGWRMYQHQEINRDILVSYGYGDGGGGVTEKMLEQSRRMASGLPGLPKIKHSHALSFFNKLKETLERSGEHPLWSGELYLEFHRGTYTSMARNKRDNRRCEYLMQDAEQLSVFTIPLGVVYPKELFRSCWRLLLLNQFHDILPGSSIEEVYFQTAEDYKKLQLTGAEIREGSLDILAASADCNTGDLLFYNPLDTIRDDAICFESAEPATMITNTRTGEYSVVQSLGSDRYIAHIKGIPPIGYQVYSISGQPENTKRQSDNYLSVSREEMENRFYKIEFDKNGEISSLYDKVCRRELIPPGETANQLQAFEDKPLGNDNWDIDIFFPDKLWNVRDIISISTVENGPVRGSLRIERNFLSSRIVQYVSIYSETPRIDFKTFIDWKESDILLKAAFPVDITTDKATFDIQFGNVERDTHNNTSWQKAQFEVSAHKWADLSEDDYGAALLNDSKYGYDVKNGCLRLTLLKSGTYPNPRADKEKHQFTYSFLPHKGDWRTGGVEKQASFINRPVYTKQIMKKGSSLLPSGISLFSCDVENVTIDTVKAAESGDGIILRIFESRRRRCNVTIRSYFPVESVRENNMLEEDFDGFVVLADVRTIKLSFRPYEIKTLRLKLKKQQL